MQNLAEFQYGGSPYYYGGMDVGLLGHTFCWWEVDAMQRLGKIHPTRMRLDPYRSRASQVISPERV